MQRSDKFLYLPAKWIFNINIFLTDRHKNLSLPFS